MNYKVLIGLMLVGMLLLTGCGMTELEKKLLIIQYISAFFCLETALAGIFGLLNGTLLAVAIIILYESETIRIRNKNEKEEYS